MFLLKKNQTPYTNLLFCDFFSRVILFKDAVSKTRYKNTKRTSSNLG